MPYRKGVVSPDPKVSASEGMGGSVPSKVMPRGLARYGRGPTFKSADDGAQGNTGEQRVCKAKGQGADVVTAKVLGPLGGEVMGVLWRRSQASVGEIEADLNRLRSKPLSYKTVLTICGPLETRGLVGHEKIGRAYHYRPLLTERDLLASEAHRQVADLMERFGSLAVSGFLAEMGPNFESLHNLKRLYADEDNEDSNL